jgi:phage terminase large subunit-like protein
VKSRGPSIERFFGRYLRHVDGKRAGEPFLMEPWQRAFTNYFHQLDEHGRRVFRLGILGIPRGNGKSPLAAGYGLYETVARKDGPKNYCLAASQKQASIVHNYARGFVEGGPLQHHGLRSGAHSITYPRGQALFECLTTSGLGVHGKNPATLIGDELHAFVTKVQRETWVGMWTAMQKRVDPYALGITTAGWDKTTMLGATYDEALTMPLAPIRHSNPCLRIHENRADGVLLWWYGIPEELHGEWDNPELWRHANPASWLEIEDLRKILVAPGFDELDFQRLILNMWTTAAIKWLPDRLWRDLYTEQPFPESRVPIWVGVDVGWDDDSTAVTWATRLEDGRIMLKAKIWTTRADQVGEYVPGGTMDLSLVERFILEELKPRYRIRELAYDPSFFGRSAQILRSRGLREKQLVEMPPWHAHTWESWVRFKQLATTGGLAHDGDADLAAHVAAAGVKLTPQGPKVKKASSGKIDALAAGVLAVARCDLNTIPSSDKPNVFWMTADGDPGGGGDGEDETGR